jgi:hypothetical protein
MVMRGTFRLALATILTLACGFVLASDPVAKDSTAFKDSFPDAVSYPATRLTLLQDSSLTARLYDLSGARHLRQTWYESEPQGLLVKLFPGVRVLRQVYNLAGEHIDFENDWALHNGRLRRLDRLNQLLLDAGLTFDSTEMPTIAKMAVLFATYGKSFPDTGYIGRHPYPLPAHGFPAITFLSVKKGEWQHPKQNDIYNLRRGMYVDCIVDGQRAPMFVSFIGNRPPQPEEVFALSDRFLQRFEYALPDGH